MKKKNPQSIFIDFHYLKNLNKGFGQFCLNLGKNLVVPPSSDIELTYYLPFSWRNRFGKKPRTKIAYDFHRYSNFKKEYDVWHAVTHLSKIEPENNNRSKLVYTIHDAIFSLFDRPNSATKNQYENLQNRINKSSGLVFISEATKRNIHQKFSIPEHVHQYVIYNGNPCANMTPIKTKKHSFPYLLCVGEFRGYKNQKSLIPMLHFLDKSLQLVFVGKCSSEQKEKISSLAKKHQVEDRIIIKGNVQEKEKIQLYSNATALVHPSLAEGFGLPVLEAMSFGVPVIISDNTSLPEVGGAAANYWKNHEPEYMAGIVITALEEFRQKPEQKTASLKAQASKFSWEKAAREYLQVYREIAEIKS